MSYYRPTVGYSDTDAQSPEEEFMLREFEKKGAEQKWRGLKEEDAKIYGDLLGYWFEANLTKHKQLKNLPEVKKDPEKWSEYVSFKDLLELHIFATDDNVNAFRLPCRSPRSWCHHEGRSRPSHRFQRGAADRRRHSTCHAEYNRSWHEKRLDRGGRV